VATGHPSGKGTVGAYYQFNPVLEGAANIVLESEDFTNLTRWTLVTPLAASGTASVTKGTLVESLAKVYRYVGTSGSVDLGTTDYTNTALWEEATVYQSNAAAIFKLALDDKFYVVKPVNLENPVLTLRNVGTLLIEQRDQILDWITSHANNAEAVARYSVQLEVVTDLIESLGLTDVLTTSPSTTSCRRASAARRGTSSSRGRPAARSSARRISLDTDRWTELTSFSGTPDHDTASPDGTPIVKKELDALFIELPNVYAAPGSVFIEASDSLAADFSGRVGTSLKARSGASITIVNKTPFATIVNDAVIRDNTRVTVVDGQLVTLTPGKVYFNGTSLGGASVDTTLPSITITQSSLPESQQGLGGFDLPDIPQDMYIVGDVINENGGVTIRNDDGSINVSGEIRGATLDIDAAADFNLNTEAWFHTNRDPRQYIDYDLTRALVYNTEGTKTTRSFATTSAVTGGSGGTTDVDLDGAIATNSHRILAQGSIAITARFLNINGIVQSGAQTVELDVASNFTASGTSSFIDDDGHTLAGISFGPDGVPVKGYFDAAQGAIVVDDIVPQGGRITLAGQIISTGNGMLRVANGYANVKITNASAYDLVLNRIDTTTKREGRITIIDTTTLRKVEYLADGSTIFEREYSGALTDGDSSDNGLDTITYTLQSTTPHAFGDAITYQPRSGQYYMWVEGQELTQVTLTKWEKSSFNLFGGGTSFEDSLSADTSYQWKTREFRDERPLLESEGVAVESLLLYDANGNPLESIVPDASKDMAYTIVYERKVDADIDLIPGVTKVWNVSNQTVYQYRSDQTIKEAVLSAVNYTDTAVWDVVQTGVTTYTNNPTSNEFRSDYVNFTRTVETWTTGGGWLRKKTHHTLLTEIEGKTDYYTHTLQADAAIGIDFIQGASAPKIEITTTNDLLLQGNLQVTDGTWKSRNAVPRARRRRTPRSSSRRRPARSR
jgi:hypothetical protein